MTARLLRVREMIKKEARQLLRDPRTRMMIFVAPIVQLVVLGYAVNTDIKNTATFVIDSRLGTSARPGGGAPASVGCDGLAPRGGVTSEHWAR